MPKPRLKFLHKEVSRHRQIYWYFRRGKSPRVRIRAPYGSERFHEEYLAAFNGNPLPQEAAPPTPKRYSPRCKSYVYFALSAGMVKIGISSNPKKRLESLSTGSAAPIRIIKKIDGDARLERELHNRFAGLRSHGEWFFFSGGLVDFINGQQDAEQRERQEIIL